MTHHKKWVYLDFSVFVTHYIMYKYFISGMFVPHNEHKILGGRKKSVAEIVVYTFKNKGAKMTRVFTASIDY